MRKFNRFLLALLLLIGLPFYWLLVDNRPGDVPAKPVTIEQLRALAASLPGAAPSRVEVELVAYRRLPGTLFVAGSGFKRRAIGVMAFRLPVAGAAPIVIDSGLTGKAADEMGFERYLPAAQLRVQAALRKAGLVLFTHEHIDHQGGLVALADPAAFARTAFNAGQVAPAKWTDQLPWPAGARPKPRITGSVPVAVAPGVVAIPAPSHTPGSQMIYVRLASGREVLFAGDIATLAENWEQLRARSRLVGDWIAPENRSEVYAWLRTIRMLKAQAPKLEVVPGHDYEWIKYDKSLRGFTEKFGI
jgi:glyoxylase-like metal-dependent hydrolase (beta-lactamase superfamily II)